MSEIRATLALRDDDGTVIAFCNPGMGWKESKGEVIRDIEHGSERYCVKPFGAPPSYIGILTLGGMKCPLTSPDGFGRNNLQDLPSCQSPFDTRPAMVSLTVNPVQGTAATSGPVARSLAGDLRGPPPERNPVDPGTPPPWPSAASLERGGAPTAVAVWRAPGLAVIEENSRRKSR